LEFSCGSDLPQGDSLKSLPWSFDEVRLLTRFACLLALGIALNTLEGMVLPRGWPVRLGLANLSILCGLYLLRWRDLVTLSVLRVLITALIFGTFFHLSMWLGLAGGLASVLVMGLSYRIRGRALSMIGISMLGAAAHISAQLALFAFFFAPGILRFLPLFLALGSVGGLVIGSLMIQIERRLPLEP